MCVLGSYHWPADVVQAEGLDATFLCQHPSTSGSIGWLINRTSLRNFNAEGVVFVIAGLGNSTETLAIPAISQYNGSSVVCTLYIIEPNGTAMIIDSTPATLTVQGISLLRLLSCHSDYIIIYVWLHTWLIY